MKIVLKGTNSLLYLFCPISRPFVVFCNVAWPCKVIYSPIWPFMVLYGHIIVFYGRSWQNVDLIGLVSSFLAVIDPNSFGLVQKRKAIKEDTQKQT